MKWWKNLQRSSRILLALVLFLLLNQVWAALGTAVVSVAGIVFFGERFDLAKVICLSMIVLGVVGLELTGQH